MGGGGEGGGLMVGVVAGVLGELLGGADDDDLLMRGDDQMGLVVDDGREGVQWLDGGKVYRWRMDMFLVRDWLWLDGIILRNVDEKYRWDLCCLHCFWHKGIMRLL